MCITPRPAPRPLPLLPLETSLRLVYLRLSDFDQDRPFLAHEALGLRGTYTMSEARCSRQPRPALVGGAGQAVRPASENRPPTFAVHSPTRTETSAPACSRMIGASRWSSGTALSLLRSTAMHDFWLSNNATPTWKSNFSKACVYT